MDISGIDYLGLDRVLKRGSGKIIAKRNDALLIRDHISGAYMLACKDAQAGMPLLDCYIGHDCDLLMVSDYSLGNAAFEAGRDLWYTVFGPLHLPGGIKNPRSQCLTL